MNTLTELRRVAKRLVDVGWNECLRRHGFDLVAALTLDDKDFAEALAAKLAVDRSVPGFIDFTTAGNRAMEPGKPAASLLYHALASPFVHPDGTDTPGNASQYPTLAELDAVENYIFGLQQVDLSKLRNPVIAVLAYEYRTAQRSPHGHHADLAYSRCGVARVGTAAAAYDAINRGFAGSDEHGAIRAVPARYAAFVAEHVKPDDRRVKPDKHVAIMARQRADQWRDFALPVHKLFPGSDCLADTDLSISFNEFHRNEKLARVHRNGGIRVVDGFDVDIYPFVRNSENPGDLVCLKAEGASVAVVPIPQDTLVRTAEQFNNRSDRMEIVRFHVPPATRSNRFFTSLLLPSAEGGARHAPEYVNIRHKVERHNNVLRIVDINTLPDNDFAAHLRDGGYEAAHFIDDSCDGVVSTVVNGLPPLPLSVLPAYSLVTAPDFLPMSDQTEITAWSRRSPRNREYQFSQGGPDPLCEGRRPANLNLPLPGQPNARAFAETEETIVAIIGTAPLSQGVGGNGIRRRSPSFLTDAASNEFAPGWDVSLDRQDGTVFYAAYGLGSPFPEDAKLCAALNSYWPAVAPDASRTFGMQRPPTAIPMLDGELGHHPKHPEVLKGKVTSGTGWDGECGPFFEEDDGKTYVNYASIRRSDYVSNALNRTLRVNDTSGITSNDLIARMEALQRCIAALPPGNDLVNRTRLWLVRAEAVSDWSQHAEQADQALTGPGFLYDFAEVPDVEQDGKPVPGNPLRDGATIPNDVLRRRIPVATRYTCQLSETLLLFRQTGNAAWTRV